MSVKIGSFTQAAATGNQSVTGLGFVPKVIFLYAGSATSDGESGSAFMICGIGISTTDRRVYSCTCQDATSPTKNQAAMESDKIFALWDFANNGLAFADLVSMNSDGFTLNWNTTDGVARVINYIAIGGSDLTNVKGGEETVRTTTGTKATTGVGFQPDFLQTMTSLLTTTSPNNETGSIESPRFGIGYGNSTTSRGYSSVMYNRTGFDFGLSSQRAQKTDKILGFLNDGTLRHEADLSSLDSDGYTLNYGTVGGSAEYFYHLAMKGGSYKVGSFSQATSTGNQSTTGVGFQPNLLLLQSFNNATSSSLQTGARFSIGAGISSSSRFSLWSGHNHQSSPLVARQALDRTKIIKLYTPVAGGSTLNAAADLVSLDSDGFTLNWTTADATAREILYVAFSFPNGDAAVVNRFRTLLGVGI